MIVTKEQSSDGMTRLRLSGNVDEHSDFEKSFGPLSGDVRVNCRSVTLINSIGIKNWIQFFSSITRSQQARLTFVECHPVVVEQMNYITNFISGASVESVMAPYICEHCRKELLSCIMTEQFKKSGFQLPEVKCDKCNRPAVFDDEPEEFFSFMKR